MGTSPIATARGLTPHGGYRYQRSTGKTHAGVDLVTREGELVLAPEAGRVIAAWFDDATPGWRRYGPAGVALLGASGVVHVLAHLSRWRWPDDNALRPLVGDTYAEGQPIGRAAAYGHVHWETRRADRAPWPLARRLEDVRDPFEWLSENRTTPAAPPAAAPARGIAAAVRRAAVAQAQSDALSLLGAMVLAYALTRRSNR